MYEYHRAADGGVTVRNGSAVLSVGKAVVDAAIDERYLLGELVFSEYDSMPPVIPGQGGGSLPEWLTITPKWRAEETGVFLDAVISCRRPGGAVLRGVAFCLRGLSPEGASLRFAGNLPFGAYTAADLSSEQAVTSWFCNAVSFLDTGSLYGSVVLIDPMEAWTTGFCTDSEGRLCIINVTGTSCRLEEGEELTVGTLVLQLSSSREERSLALRELYRKLGYPTERESPDIHAVYCCHPSGTTDTWFADRDGDLDKLGKKLPRLKEIGIDTVWLLPICPHPDKLIYAPYEMRRISPRYGGAAQAKAFCDTAHRLGMRVLFDLVPHGPAETDALALQHPEWCAKKRDGTPQTEWDCLSFDYADPGYRAYIEELVSDHIAESGIDGIRLDSAAGGKPNWAAVGRRPSSSYLWGGCRMDEAVLRAFRRQGKTPVLINEMFHAIPNFVPYSRYHYNNALYRLLWALNTAELTREEYAAALTDWLSVQGEMLPDGAVLLNWLQNHDTVLWAGEAKRASAVYGAGLVRAMFTMICLMDGVPVLYQGDENPALYGLPGENLEEFFKKLLAVREDRLASCGRARWRQTGKPLLRFDREGAGRRFTVLINLSDRELREKADGEAVYLDAAEKRGALVLLAPYGASVTASELPRPAETARDNEREKGKEMQ